MYHIRDTGSNTRGEHVELKHGQRREIEIGNREKKKKRKKTRARERYEEYRQVGGYSGTKVNRGRGGRDREEEGCVIKAIGTRVRQ